MPPLRGVIKLRGDGASLGAGRVRSEFAAGPSEVEKVTISALRVTAGWEWVGIYGTGNGAMLLGLLRESF